MWNIQKEKVYKSKEDSWCVNKKRRSLKACLKAFNIYQELKSLRKTSSRKSDDTNLARISSLPSRHVYLVSGELTNLHRGLIYFTITLFLSLFIYLSLSPRCNAITYTVFIYLPCHRRITSWHCSFRVYREIKHRYLFFVSWKIEEIGNNGEKLNRIIGQDYIRVSLIFKSIFLIVFENYFVWL